MTLDFKQNIWLAKIKNKWKWPVMSDTVWHYRPPHVYILNRGMQNLMALTASMTPHLTVKTKSIGKQHIESQHPLYCNWTILIVSFWSVTVERVAEPGKSNSRPSTHINGLTFLIQVAEV
jgi:hypothetical protein